jgi:hypothetical protein
MYKKLIVILVFLSTSSILRAQDVLEDSNGYIEKYSISNPDVYAFEKYNLNPVNYFVGKASISVPIYTIKTGGLEYPITLNYDTGGIKVDQVASNVGLGWNLSRTIITRTIQNANDFDNTGSTHNYTDYTNFNLPSIENDKNFQASIDNGYTAKNGYFFQKQHQLRVGNNTKYVDFLPDIYNFYSPHFKTNFFFNDINTPVEFEPKGTKINASVDFQKIATGRGWFFSNTWHNNHDLYTKDFFNISITSNSGVKYTFNDCDFAYNEDFKVHSVSNNFLDNNYEKVDSPAQISAWHISEIMDMKTEKKIEFIYETTHSNTNGSLNSGFDFKAAQMSYGYNTIPSSQNIYTCHYYAPIGDYPSTGNKYLLSASARVDVRRKILKKIKFEEGSVEFNYNNEGIGGPGVARTDVANGNFITQIYLKNKQGDIIKTFNLNYSRFESDYNVGEFNPFSEYSTYRYTRLKLVSVEEEGKPPHEFTYEEDIKLPPINSFSVDFAGYYNNSNDITTNTALISQNRHPQLYYYPNQFEKSLLPFPIPNLSYTTIPGYFNREANNYAKAWSLKKIKYPTGGYSEFEYESNTFKIWGEEIKGGGIRVKKQMLRDENDYVVRVMNYDYDNSDNLSSGSLFAYPYFGHPMQQFFVSNLHYYQDPEIEPILHPQNPSLPGHPYNTVQWKIFDKSNLLEDITSGAFVGYSKVIEFETGNGRRELNFTSNDLTGFENKVIRYDDSYYLDDNSTLPVFNSCINDFIITNSAFGANIFTDNSHKRGKLMKELIYNQSNDLLKQVDYNYEENIFDTYSFNQTTSKTRFNPNAESTMKKFITSRKKYEVGSYQLIDKEIKTFYQGQEFKSKEEYTYNNFNLIQSVTTINSTGDTERKEFKYPFDTQVSGLPYMSNLVTQNRLSEPIKEEFYKNNELVFAKQSNYATFQDSIIYLTYLGYWTDPYTVDNVLYFPKSISTVKGVGQLEEEIIIDLRDYRGNILQYHNKQNKYTSIIWGYGNSKPVAKIENAKYSDIHISILMSIHSVSDIGTDEPTLINHLNDLRSNPALANTMITTYTYIPFVGISTVTDSKGDKVTYHYDNLERLQYVKDKNGNILSENEYYYIPQN